MARLRVTSAWDKLWEYLPPVELAPRVGAAVDEVQYSGRWTIEQIESLYTLVTALRDYEAQQRRS
jgi:hypothetical protein